MSRQSRAERWYGHLLRLYPADYRERFGVEMQQTFRDLYREQRHPAAGFWARLAADAVRGAASENLALMRSGEMKLYWSNSADQRVLAWGIGLMAPAGLFFMAAAAGVLRRVQLPVLRPSLPVLQILIVVLPLVALAINAVALARQITKRRDRGLSEKFVTKYFWTLALMIVAGGWLVLLFGHDTIGCALQNLPMLNWAGFQHCSATH
ncbi:MAG TPA: hypothetical protein VGH44_01175 [Candidatus Saccharimonadia bacterium]|jgi:hypothetical protein